MVKFRKCEKCGKTIEFYHPAVKYCPECARKRRTEIVYMSCYKKVLEQGVKVNA